jgi:hypothetical protein
MKGINIAVWFVAIAFAQNSFATNSVGRTQGSYATSPTGAATYSIPIWAPKGPNGVQPGIALTYNSQQGNGYVGVGWGVSGLSSIYRCNLTIAQDGAAAPVALATSDGYCMDGQRLRLTGGDLRDGRVQLSDRSRQLRERHGLRVGRQWAGVLAGD